jgi:hypothetical protein
MGKLKPIGSEKLTGDDKIRRIMEIARYNENSPSSLNETSRTEYGLNLADGNNYQIVKERQGYIIKKTISESETDYIEPMKNRKYYSSYSQALKRLNLLAGELNRINENEEGISLFGEQKKFVLKTPKPDPETSTPAAAAPPAAPPPVPQPELPPSPDAGMPEDFGDEGMPAGEGMPGEMGDEEMDIDIEGGEEIPVDQEPSDKEERVSFRTIQKLTGKLTQKIRVLDNEEGMTSENIKYVINMVLSSLDLKSLSEEDKEDIISKFEEESEDLEGDDFGGEDLTDDSEVEDIQSDMDVEIPVDQEMGENYNGAIIDSIFGESKIDKVLSKYFEFSKKEIMESQENKLRRKESAKRRANSKMKIVSNLCETKEQQLASQRFLEENSSFVFVGKTNKSNLVFENKNRQIKITPNGRVL